MALLLLYGGPVFLQFLMLKSSLSEVMVHHAVVPCMSESINMVLVTWENRYGMACLRMQARSLKRRCEMHCRIFLRIHLISCTSW